MWGALLLEELGGFARRVVVEEGAGPWPWVSAGVGVAAAVTGLIYGKQALDSASRARAEERRGPAQSHKDEAESSALVADVMFGAAAIGVGLSVWLWLRADATANAAGHLVAVPPRPIAIAIDIGYFRFADCLGAENAPGIGSGLVSIVVGYIVGAGRETRPREEIG